MLSELPRQVEALGRCGSALLARLLDTPSLRTSDELSLACDVPCSRGLVVGADDQLPVRARLAVPTSRPSFLLPGKWKIVFEAVTWPDLAILSTGADATRTYGVAEVVLHDLSGETTTVETVVQLAPEHRENPHHKLLRISLRPCSRLAAWAGWSGPSIEVPLRDAEGGD